MKEAKTRNDKIFALECQLHDIERRQKNLEFQRRNLENKLLNLKMMGEINDGQGQSTKSTD